MRDVPVRAHYAIPGGDAGTFGDTIPWMRLLVQEGKRDPLVHARARSIVAGAPEKHPATAIYDHVQSLPYAYDDVIARSMGADPDTSEVLQGARHQAEIDMRGEPLHGDCDCRSIYLQSMLESLGYPTRFAVVKGPGRQDYSHVYSEVELEDGSWAPLDTIMDGQGGRPFFLAGQEVPPSEGRDKRVIGTGQREGCFVALVLAALVFWGIAR